MFLDAAVQVARAFPDARFMVVGGTLFGLEKEYAFELRDQAHRLGLDRFIYFTGYRADVHRFLAAADVVVHGHIEPDPFPTVLLEAMALGKPVIASNLGGPREMIEDAATGLLVPPKNLEHLVDAILTLLNDPDHRVRMGQAGALRVHKCFSAERMVRQFEALYTEIIEE